MLDGTKLALRSGESAEVGVGRRHPPVNEGDEEVKLLCRLEPGHEGFGQAMHKYMHGLTEGGITNEDGVPGSSVTSAIAAEMVGVFLDRNSVAVSYGKVQRGQWASSQVAEVLWQR